MKTAIKSIRAIQILDSRGNPTVSVRLELEDGSVGWSSVPAGASTGEFEAAEVRDGDYQVYRGRGVLKAVQNIDGPIAAALRGLDASDQAKVDRTLLELDGTANRQHFGANAILGVSIAAAKAASASTSCELFEYLGGSNAVVLPVPLVNVINGGAHADNSLDIQEFMIIPHGAPSFSEALRMSAETFHFLGKLLRNDGYNTGVGDEGGYAPRLESMELALDFLLRAIERAGYRPGEDISLALDVAASELVKDNPAGEVNYIFAKSSGPLRSASEMIDFYEDWLSRYPIISIEDGLGENDWTGWKELTTRLGSRMQLIGDDLFATNASRIQRGIEEGVANSVMVKPNQIGTLSETLAAIEVSRGAGYNNVISHRSGETDDATIADLAVAVNAGQIKTGSMCRGERIAKYNRLLWIENKLGGRAQYTSPY